MSDIKSECDNIIKKICVMMSTDLDTIFVFVHIVVSLILVKYLMDNIVVLTLLLGFILGYISYDQKELPPYTFVLAGCIIYILEVLSTTTVTLNDLTQKNNKMPTYIDTIKKNIWKFPYYGIISYYLFLLFGYVEKINNKQ